MDYVLLLKDKLRRRYENLMGSDYNVFHTLLIHFIKFLQEETTFKGILLDLQIKNKNIWGSVFALFPFNVENKETWFYTVRDSNQIKLKRVIWLADYQDELESVAACYFVLLGCTYSLKNNMIEVIAGACFAPNYWEFNNRKNPFGDGMYPNSLRDNNAPDRFDEPLAKFKSTYLKPFYHYLVEQLDQVNINLTLLLNYKFKSEWFQRNQLFALWEEPKEANSIIPETRLAYQLYEYLYDKGLSFDLEPVSPSGKVDMVGRSNQLQPDDMEWLPTSFVIDAKVFNPEKSRGKEYISKGFFQVHHYLVERNESIGYLVIFQTSQRGLDFDLDGVTSSVPYFLYNHKTIFALVIDIASHPKTASKRGKGDTVKITSKELCGYIEKEEQVQEKPAT